MYADRRNIVVMADESHQSHYDFIDGCAHEMRSALPRAWFIGLSGTPLNCRRVKMVKSNVTID